MSHEVETMAFANETPWHGLGNRVDPSVSVDQMLVAAGLDWTVNLYPTFAKLGDNFVRVPNKSALIRDVDNKVLTTASDNWKPVQNRDVLEFFREYAEAGGCTLETAGSLNGGKRIWALANLNKGFTTGNGRDAVKGFLLFSASHEMGKANTVRPTAVRVVCANTMAMAMQDEAQYSQSHIENFDFAKAKDAVGIAREALIQTEKDVHKMEALSISQFDTVRVLAKHFQPEMSSEENVKVLLADPCQFNTTMHGILLSVEDAPGAIVGNAWGVLNGVTYWADHVAGRSQDARLTKSWFGENARLKLAVQADLLAMAE